MEPDPPADERILQAALRRFAVDGLGAPLRAVAEDAGVSAGLIIHHFGSRERLLEACDERALRTTREAKSRVVRGGAGEMLAQLAALERYAPVVGYVLRRLQAGGPLARSFLDDFVADAEVYLAEGVEAGMFSPSQDPAGRARALTEMALGSLLLQLPAQRDHLDLDELPMWLHDYTASQALPRLELYTTPLLTDSTLLESYLAATQGDEDHHPQPTEGTSP